MPLSRLPSDMILFPRRMFYIEAVLWLVVAAAAFAAGYFIGRGSGAPGPRGGQDEAAGQRIPVEGRIFYDSLPDDGAVVLLLPVGKAPARRPTAVGLAPDDAAPANDAAELRAVRQMGGAYARANASGDFMAYVPRRGRYFVLVVSRHAPRSREAPTEEGDLAKLEEYFDHANRLIHRRQYRWTEEDIELNGKPLDVTFPSERPR
ncbi:MAG: hypothetical protein ABR915_15790 [Thermoguttaceae bacterium]|jgi:hypothetical protein